MYGIFKMPPGESSYPGGSEYVWQRGVEGELWAEIYLIFQRKTQKTDTATIVKILLPK